VTELLHRTYPVEVTTAAGPDETGERGRILDLRVVPYNVSARVRDPGGEPYLEQFAPGAFARACRAPDRVELRYAHGSGLADWIGRGVEFREADDGLDGSVRVLGGVFGDQALTLVDEGLLTGLSVGFADLARRNRRAADGAVIRERCHLVEVSLTPNPAYAGAVVTGRRHAQLQPELAELRVRGRSRRGAGRPAARRRHQPVTRRTAC
jgi:HK97 family phage prohead protease